MGLGGIVGWGGSNNNALQFAQNNTPESQEWQPFDSTVNTPTAYDPITSAQQASGWSGGNTPTVASNPTSSGGGFNINAFASNPRGYLIGQGIKGIQSLFGGGNKTQAQSDAVSKPDQNIEGTDGSDSSSLSSLFSL